MNKSNIKLTRTSQPQQRLPQPPKDIVCMAVADLQTFKPQAQPSTPSLCGAWAAGCLDGEGCIQLARVKRRDSRRFQ